eukprot:CAMPEP_0203643266 /NCGR_PEP_ID=MMETSP0088-20131115/8706_1 /ASSEMBLY_ACC=CAM_ASM_001087 /TAXON_ID=426623 /ORGANISM="Chaetoceros affinis, Strain CCMP159" /LENGTH=301 /DNA_ID=CAMNT_0050499399 /DNA_START=95 /DNA_END=1000 /DNA_ORIENTATION=+
MANINSFTSSPSASLASCNDNPGVSIRTPTRMSTTSSSIDASASTSLSASTSSMSTSARISDSYSNSPIPITDNNVQQGLSDEEIFYQTAQSLEPVTDKVSSHTYHVMYGQFLLPFYRRKPNMRFFEIGLGCDMNYGPGASVALWRKLIPQAEIWEGEYDAECVENAKRNGMLNDINVVTGDQGDVNVLDDWIRQMNGGEFDVVIDDGGHDNCQIWTTFQKFWPLLKPGGLYFIEDMLVGRYPQYQLSESPLCSKGLVVTDQLQRLIELMTTYTPGENRDEPIGEVKFISCQLDACVLGKK